MFHDKIKSFFSSAVDKTVSSISEYAVNPGRDFSRSRKLPPDRLITFLVSEGAGTTKNELLDFFGLDPEKPTSSALNQQRAKLKPEAVEAVFKEFNSSIDSLDLLEADFKFLGARAVHLVMDKGFYSEPNVDVLYENHYRFSIGVPLTASIATGAIEENRIGMDSHEHFINIGEDDLYAVTKCIKWKGHRCYLHTYYDSLKAELENKKFTHRLLQCHDELTSHNERPENQVFYDKYFFVRDFPKRERKVQYNEDAVYMHKQNHIGWLVIISNKTKDATEALRSYRQKDAIEKGVDDLKNDLDMKRLRIHSNTAMDGRIFIQFVALILPHI